MTGVLLKKIKDLEIDTYGTENEDWILGDKSYRQKKKKENPAVQRNKEELYRDRRPRRVWYQTNQRKGAFQERIKVKG